MHEFAIIDSIFKIVEKTIEDNQLKSVSRVILHVGKLRQVVPEFLQFAFETVSEGSPAQGAELVVVEIPIKVKCEACGHEALIEHQTYVCPACGHFGLEVLTGKELFIESIEGEEQDAD